MTTAGLEAKVGAAAVLVYALMQASKGWNPVVACHLSGWKAAAVNVLLCAAGVLATTPEPQRFTIGTLAAVLIAATSAAGIHGTVAKLTNGSTANQCEEK